MTLQSDSDPPPRPRISSSPSLPASLSGFSVPESRPPLGQPRRSYVVKATHFSLRTLVLTLMVCVPSHRASSSDAVAWGEFPCAFLEVSERVPAQPTNTRRTAHPITKVPTTTMRCGWRTTVHHLPYAWPVRTSRTTTKSDAASASPANPTSAPADKPPEVSERTSPPVGLSPSPSRARSAPASESGLVSVQRSVARPRFP